MIVLPRAAVRAFRAVARKAATGRPRGPAPPVLLRPVGDAVVLTTAFPTVTVSYRVAVAAAAGDPFAVPMAALDAADAPGDDPITVAPVSPRRAEVRWADGGLPRVTAVEMLPAARVAVPADPDSFRPVPAEFLAALHEAGRSAARQPAPRFALEKVQVRGTVGEVVGTDGRWVFVQGGFRLAFQEDVLVPAVPVFGCPAVKTAGTVEVGRTASHLVVRAGPWAIFLAADATARYPAVRDVVPKTPVATLTLAEEDAAHLLAVLPRLPGRDEEDRPVTLDAAAGRPPCVQACAEGGGETVEVHLARSAVTGVGRVAVNRDWLRRALALGCRTVRVAGPLKPAVATAGDVLLLTAPLATVALVEPAAPAAPALLSPVTERITAMKPTDANGHGPPRAPSTAPPDPLAEAEALRDAVAAAAQHAARLVALLRGRKREQKALSQAWASLKTLNLAP